MRHPMNETTIMKAAPGRQTHILAGELGRPVRAGREG
jgi:hypothetical protein